RQDLDTKMKADAHQSAHLAGYHALETLRLNPYEGIDMRGAFWVNYHPRMDPARTSPEIPKHVAEFAEHDDFEWDKSANKPRLCEA
ncbi:hypothetical protein ACQ10P_15390, partial [Enterococcus faecalis]|uniref:hypothetical protein n=1 Tax=Enterococcus faecalis TaxID=1351 RepID=UPI003D6BDC7F